jgi:hypothetical protein
LPEEREIEEDRVHRMTCEILSRHEIKGIREVLQYYSHWQKESREFL